MDGVLGRKGEKMGRIKGRYVCTVCIEMDVDENLDGLLPYEVIERQFKEELNKEIEKLLRDNVVDDEIGKLEVIQTHCDMWRTEDGKTD